MTFVQILNEFVEQALEEGDEEEGEDLMENEEEDYQQIKKGEKKCRRGLKMWKDKSCLGTDINFVVLGESDK